MNKNDDWVELEGKEKSIMLWIYEEMQTVNYLNNYNIQYWLNNNFFGAAVPNNFPIKDFLKEYMIFIRY